MAININCAIIGRLAENPLQEKNCCPLCYDEYQCIIVEEYNVLIILGGPGINDTCLKFAE